MERKELRGYSALRVIRLATLPPLEQNVAPHHRCQAPKLTVCRGWPPRKVPSPHKVAFTRKEEMDLDSQVLLHWGSPTKEGERKLNPEVLLSVVEQRKVYPLVSKGPFRSV